MSVSLFTPIVHNSNPKENLAVLRWTTGFFNFGQTCYQVTPISRDHVLYIEQAEHQKPSWFGVVLRVVAIITIVIPLFMIISAMIYRAANKFEVKPLETFGRFSEYMPDIQKLICQYAPFDSIALSLVNKQMNSFFKDGNPNLSRNKAMMIAVEQSLKVANLLNGPHKVAAYCRIAEFLFEIEKKDRAIAILNTPLVKDEALHRVVKIIALYDLDKALEIAKTSTSGSKKAETELLYSISLALIPIDLKKAFAIQDSLSLNKNEFFGQAACEVAKHNLEEGLVMLRKVQEENHRVEFLIKIVNHLEEVNPEKAKEFYPELDDLINRHGSINKKVELLLKNNKIREAIQYVERSDFLAGYSMIAKKYAQVNLEEALEWTKTLGIMNQFDVMVDVVKEIQNPDEAKRLIEVMVEELGDLLPTRLIDCVILMAKFDVKRALELANLIENDLLRARSLIYVIENSTCNNPDTVNLHNRILETLKNADFAFNYMNRLKLIYKLQDYLNLAKALAKKI